MNEWMCSLVVWSCVLYRRRRSRVPVDWVTWRKARDGSRDTASRDHTLFGRELGARGGRASTWGWSGQTADDAVTNCPRVPQLHFLRSATHTRIVLSDLSATIFSLWYVYIIALLSCVPFLLLFYCIACLLGGFYEVFCSCISMWGLTRV